MSSPDGVPVDVRLSAYRIGTEANPRYVWGIGIEKAFMAKFEENNKRARLVQSAGRLAIQLGDQGIHVKGALNSKGKFVYAQAGVHHLAGMTPPSSEIRATAVAGHYNAASHSIEFRDVPEFVSQSFVDVEAGRQDADPEIHFPGTHFVEDVRAAEADLVHEPEVKAAKVKKAKKAKKAKEQAGEPDEVPETQPEETPVEAPHEVPLSEPVAKVAKKAPTAKKANKVIVVKASKGASVREPIAQLEDLRDDCIAVVLNSKLSFKAVQERGGPSPQTTSKWLYKETRFPQLATVRAMLNACDHEITIAPYGSSRIEPIASKGIQMPSKATFRKTLAARQSASSVVQKMRDRRKSK
jgi:hypothetical protein